MILGGGFPCLPILVGFSHDAKTGGKRNPYLRLTTTADDDAITWLTNYGTFWCIRQQLQLLHTLKHLPWNNNDILLYRQLPFALHRTATNSSSIKSSNKTTVSFASLGINYVPKSSTGSVFRYIVWF